MVSFLCTIEIERCYSTYDKLLKYPESKVHEANMGPT